jgi:hypothetical protein
LFAIAGKQGRTGRGDTASCEWLFNVEDLQVGRAVDGEINPVPGEGGDPVTIG